MVKSRSHGRRVRILRISALAAALVVCSLARVSVHATPQADREYEIKAVFLYNFVKFVEWRGDRIAEPDLPMTICVLGPDPFGPALESLAGKTVKGRSVAVRRFASLEGLQACHVLFISSSEEGRLSQALDLLRTAGVLTVGETAGFTRLGGIIGFVTERNRIRFEINVEAAERAGLRISSKLLNLAKVVR